MKKHENAILTSSFNYEFPHLFPNSQDTDPGNLSSAESNLLVNLEVKCCSVCGQYSAQVLYLFDTPAPNGWIHLVCMFPDKYNSKFQSCPCKECCRSPTPLKQFALIAINTPINSRFVNTNIEECIYINTEKCKECINIPSWLRINEKTPTRQERIATLNGMVPVFPNKRRNCCLTIHATHNMKLAELLKRMLFYRDHHRESYISKCLLHSSPEKTQNVMFEHDLGDVVATAKGAVGESYCMLATKIIRTTYFRNFGRKVLVIWKDWMMWGLEHTHGGGCEQGEQINHSSHGVGYLPPIRRHIGMIHKFHFLKSLFIYLTGISIF